MSDTPFLNKMDALLKKHRGTGDGDSNAPPASEPPSKQSRPPDAWLPVLTHIIERGTAPVVAPPAATPLPPAAESAQSAAPEAPATDAAMPVVNDTLAEQLMSELAPRLSEVMEKQVAAELRKNLDQTVATLLSQLDVNVREIVRDAVAEKLKQPRDPST